MPHNIFTGRVAEGYDLGSPEMREPALLEATASFLADAADGGAALEFGIGTGRVALPLSEHGIEVHGIDISEDMVAQLLAKPGSSSIGVTVGDFATTTVPRTFSLVYLVYNALGKNKSSAFGTLHATLHSVGGLSLRCGFRTYGVSRLARSRCRST